MINSGLTSVLIKVAGAGLLEKHLGKTLGQMEPTLRKLVSPQAPQLILSRGRTLTPLSSTSSERHVRVAYLWRGRRVRNAHSRLPALPLARSAVRPLLNPTSDVLDPLPCNSLTSRLTATRPPSSPLTPRTLRPSRISRSNEPHSSPSQTTASPRTRNCSSCSGASPISSTMRLSLCGARLPIRGE